MQSLLFDLKFRNKQTKKKNDCTIWKEDRNSLQKFFAQNKVYNLQM